MELCLSLHNAVDQNVDAMTPRSFRFARPEVAICRISMLVLGRITPASGQAWAVLVWPLKVYWLFDQDAQWHDIMHAAGGLIVHTLFIAVLARRFAAVLRR